MEVSTALRGQGLLPTTRLVPELGAATEAGRKQPGKSTFTFCQIKLQNPSACSTAAMGS